MIVLSKTPDKISGLYLWYDFSDTSTINDGYIPEYNSIVKVYNKAWKNVFDLRGINVANATILSSTFSFNDDNYGILSFTAGDTPVWTRQGINNLGSVFFGEDLGVKGYTNVLTTGFYAYGLTSSIQSYLGPLTDVERSIFIVYKTHHVSSFYDDYTEVNAYHTSFSGTQLPFPGNKFGCIFDIHTPIYNWLPNSSISFNQPGFTYSAWYDQVSYMNLLKYKNDPNISYFNFLPEQGFDKYLGYPNNNYNLTHRLINYVGTPSIFHYRSIDCNTGISSSTPTASNLLTNNYVITSTEHQYQYKYLNGLICTTPDNFGALSATSDIIPPYTKGLYGGFLSIGNSSRFINTVPSETGNSVGSSIAPVDPTYQSGFNGYIGEVIYYNRKITDIEYKYIMEYLKKKWNI